MLYLRVAAAVVIHLVPPVAVLAAAAVVLFQATNPMALEVVLDLLEAVLKIASVGWNLDDPRWEELDR